MHVPLNCSPAPTHRRERVVQTPSALDAVVTSMLDWGVRLVIVGTFSFTLTQLRGLIANIVNSDFDFNSIIKLRKSFRYVHVKGVKRSRSLPDDFKENSVLRTSLDVIYQGLSQFAKTKNPMALGKALKQLRDLRDIKFGADQILSMEIAAQFKFPVSDRVCGIITYHDVDVCCSVFCFVCSVPVVFFRDVSSLRHFVHLDCAFS